MADTIQVTPQMLRSTANDIQANMEQAMGIAKGYLANQENVMNPALVWYRRRCFAYDSHRDHQ